MDNIYFKLLKKWCDGLLAHQLLGDDAAFKGGFLCPSCKMIHGRNPDAIYPLGVLYKLTKEEKYLKGLKLVFEYGKQLECADGSFYNDAQAAWPYTTVFQEIATIESLLSFGSLLDDEFKKEIEERARRMGEWLYKNLDEKSRPNINYCATNSLALLLAGRYFSNEEYIKKSRTLFAYALNHFSDNGLFYGESKNHDEVSEKGCLSIDMGYALEESIPSLVKCAFLLCDRKAKNFLKEKLYENAWFILPDGGLDNSFGVRNNKWTYYGSRTSDGLSPAYLLFAESEPLFQEVAYRNTVLLDKCSDEALLYGGPDYQKEGEYPCLHHTFEHANALAFVLETVDPKYLVSSGVKLPCEDSFHSYYPELDLYRAKIGDYMLDVSGYDFNIPFSGHAGGGSITMLYGPKGPMIMGSVLEYLPLAEPTNQQLPKKPESHRSLLPRLEKNGYYSCYYAHDEIVRKGEGEEESFFVKGGLATRNGDSLSDKPLFAYVLSKSGLSIHIENCFGAKFVLPLINGTLSINEGSLERTEDIFFLTGGFKAKEYTIVPNEKGLIDISIE